MGFYPAGCDLAPVAVAGPSVYLGTESHRRNAGCLPQMDGTPAMTTFDKREEGFERKFALDAELKFKAEARRNRLLGVWVAEKLGLSGDDVTAYAKEVVAADFEEAGSEDVFRKVKTDLDAKGIAVSETEIRTKMDELMATAVEQVKAGQ